ncbi:hypothetical protein FisN_30Lh118 [Fistulifera solaris]|uniref:Selenoprotein O n=1 Tax=Fistulifera solaris TaxID=1519565 RepID=A0A1Z5JII9_FISSO|nr:hypothetical protein FisN_30Lh118 [Fistulifera solaris]|eukprot:GAX13823.1 hypothetical protein FisN_30Lh118 [Fistulifera solaris]
MHIPRSFVTTTTTAFLLFPTNNHPSCQAFSIPGVNSSSSRNTLLKMSSTSSSATTTTDTAVDKPFLLSSLHDIQNALDNSWPRQLNAETPENLSKARQLERLSEEDDNRRKRPVYNGHFVSVKPTGLPDARLILTSESLATETLHLDPQFLKKDDFVQFVAGNTVLAETWATPYALSIMGQRYTNNCPYGTGNGYGDGRAISIAEFMGQELQLKGAGTTPFHRGADGRAVLRSSIREFLASEAMFALGVSTTRALSLVVSESLTVQRPWYSDNAVLQLPSLDDPRLAKYSPEEKQALLQQLRHQQKADPNILQSEPCAITCRVAPSFLRIGHLDLMARRVRAEVLQGKKNFVAKSLAQQELEQLIWHACYREFKSIAYDPFIESNDLKSAARVLLEQSRQNIAKMVADWIRVGFAQGNFNADNCLVAGRTMDYGPFGWMDEYHPLFAKWTGSGTHFGFMNQPNAALANYQVLVESVQAALDEDEDFVDEFVQPDVFQQALDRVFRTKLGFPEDADVADELWESLEPLLRKSRTDWTLFWRELTYLANDTTFQEKTPSELMERFLSSPTIPDDHSIFYEPPSSELIEEWTKWLAQWKDAVLAFDMTSDSLKRMYQVNPKYVLREWMLVNAYEKASRGDESELHRLYSLIQRPYDEGSTDEQEQYYRKAPLEVLTKGGTGFMS